MADSQLIGKLRELKTHLTKQYKGQKVLIFDNRNPNQRVAVWVDGDLSSLIWNESGLKFECKTIKRDNKEDQWMYFPTSCANYVDEVIVLGDNVAEYEALLPVYDVHDLIAHPFCLFRELSDIIKDLNDGPEAFDNLLLQQTKFHQNLSKTVGMPHEHIVAFLAYKTMSVASYKEYVRNNYTAAEMLMYQDIIKCLNRFTDKETVKYIHRTFAKEGLQSTVGHYHDYLRMRSQLPLEVRGNFPKYPKVFDITVHDSILEEYRKQEAKPLAERWQPMYFTEVLSKAQEFTFEDDEYTIFPPTEVVDLVNEGNKLHHCVGSYISSVASGNEYILYLRKKTEIDIPFFTVNVTPNKQVRQIHGMCNCNLPKELKPFVKAWANKFGLDISDCDGIKCHL